MMKRYVFSFFFPTQPGGRQDLIIQATAANAGTAFARAWRQVKRSPKLKGRRGIDSNFRVGCQAYEINPKAEHEPDGPPAGM